MKRRSYKELEVKPKPLSETDIESAKQAFLASGGTVQSVELDEKKFRKQRAAVSNINYRHK